MNEYQPSTILPPGQGTSKFGGTQSRIIMGGVNCQKLGANMLPGLLIAGEQYGIVTDGETVARNASANPDVIEIQNAWSLMSDEAVLNSAVAVVDYDPETLAYDAESGVLTGVTTVAFEAGTAYWCKEIVTIGEVQLYVYEPTVAGRDVREVYEAVQPVTVAAEAYNVGKVQLAQAITSKGVETSPTESYPEMAEKVNAISQKTYQINGGEMYAMQLFGSLETPNYWNLYEVLAQLLSDGRLVSYGGILLAEYYRGYDSLALAGAGSGGAYVVSDKDENGQFKMYTEDTTHTWATEFDGKGNRWVAYCFHDEYHDFQITDTNTSPRSIFIGRKVGTITLLTNTRTSNIVVPNGNNLRTYLSGSYTTNWDQSIILYLDEMPNGNLLYNYSNSAGKVYLSVANATNLTANFQSLTLDTLVIVSGSTFSSKFFATAITNVFIKAESFSYGGNNVNHMLAGAFSNLTLIDIESWNGGIVHSNQAGITKKLTLLYKTNDKTKGIYFYIDYNNPAIDVELKDGWCKPLSIVCFPNLTKENVQAHIFDRLGVNDISTGTVTITLANAVLNLFTQEEINAVVERTNITIVGA